VPEPFDRDPSVQAVIPAEIDLSHAAAGENPGDSVGPMRSPLPEAGWGSVTETSP
jgi:hypothetical protein